MAVTQVQTQSDDEVRRALLDAVDEVAGTLADCADEAERTRTLPERGWRALHDAGLFRLKAPRELGGWEADPLTQIEVIERVSYIDTTAGWTLFVGAGTLAICSAWMPEEGLADFMVDGRLPRTTAGVAVTGTAVPVQGGYRVTARWPFGSGGLHAEILGGNVRVAGTDPPRVIGVHFPTEQATIHDNWDVTSLKGTGSGDVEVADLFVPAAMTYDTFGPPARGGALYAIGLPGLVANEHGAFVLGAARRAIDETAALAKSKTRGYVVPQGVAAREVFQADLGRADIAVRAARAHLDRVNGEAWQAALDGRPIDVAMQTELRCAAVHATDTALEVARRMFRYAGAKSLFAGNVIDRCLRDITAAAQHGMVNETSWEARGRVLLGFEDVAPIS